MAKPKKQTEYLKVEDVLDSRESLNSKPGYRKDNKWHLYDPLFISNAENYEATDEQKWKSAKFLDKSYFGYYCWPNDKIKINVNSSEIFTQNRSPKNAPPLNLIIKKFQEKSFIEKFMKYNQLETETAAKFDKKNVYMFKSLFRCFGTDEAFHDIFINLCTLIDESDTQKIERAHKLAAELLNGLIKGSKYWEYKKLVALWSKLRPILDEIMENMTNETVHLWSQSFASIFVKLNILLLYFSILLTKYYFS
jgi:hypothetical protein